MTFDCVSRGRHCYVPGGLYSRLCHAFLVFLHHISRIIQEYLGSTTGLHIAVCISC